MIELTKGEEKVLDQIRNLDWGRVEITVKDGKPVMVSVRRDIKLDIKLTYE